MPPADRCTMPNVTIEGTMLHYREVGEAGGPPVVLLHAFPLHSGMWQPQFEALAGRRRLIAPDLKGFGGSDAPDDPGQYSMEGYADELAGLLDHLGVERVVLGGLSLGGYVAFAFVRRHRARVAALVLADTRAEADTPEVRDRRDKQLRQLAEEGTDPVIEAQLAALLSDHTRQHRPDVVEQARGLMAANPAAGFVGALEAMKRRPDVSDELAAIDVPTLVVVGEDDKVSPVEVAESMASRIPQARLVVVPDAGHLSSLEAPEAFNEALADFLDEVSPSSGDTTVYFNPACSNCRTAQGILAERGVDAELVHYLEQTPSREELEGVMRLLGTDDPRQMMREKEPVYAELGLEGADRDALLDAMVAHPILIQRPIVIRGNRAVIARPPERLLELFD